MASQSASDYIPLCSAPSLWWHRKPCPLMLWQTDGTDQGSFPHVWAVWIRRKHGLGHFELEPYGSISSTMSSVNSIVCIATDHSREKNAEAVLFGQAYGTSLCGPRLVHVRLFVGLSWASYQIRKIAGCACAGNAGNVFPRRRFQRKPIVSDPGMHHGTCVTHVPWCMSGSITRDGGENVPGIPGACASAILLI